MIFMKDIFIPLVLVALLIGGLNYLILALLRFIRLDFALFKIVIFFIVWYFVGPIIYNILLENVIVNENEIIRFLYMPVQIIMGLLGL
ncbi:unknown [Clostridium sp. CAG:1193]|nr:unknown [Clostridium sp. CAG:1193]